MRISSLFQKASVFFLTIILFLTNSLLLHASEANFWKNRIKSVQVARLPVSNSKPLPSLQKVSSSLPKNTFTKNRLTRKLGRHNVPHLNRLIEALPRQFGSVRQVLLPESKKSEGIVLHIQDVHMNQEAQKNIGHTISKLNLESQIDLIALEGAFQEINLDPFQGFPHQDTKQKVANYLLRENKISGPIYSSLISKIKNPPIYGIDDVKHYNQHVKSVIDSNALKKVVSETHLKWFEGIESRKNTMFNRKLRRFDEEIQKYRTAELPIGPYVKHLNSYLMTTPLAIEPFLQALSLEENLNISKVEHQRAIVINELVKKLDKIKTEELLQVSMAFRSGQVNHADFYFYLKNLCETNNVNLNQYKAMADYLQYILLAESIDVKKLYASFRKLENQIYSRLAKSDEEMTLVKESRQNYLIGKLLNFGFTKDEWEEYKKVRNTKYEQRKLGLNLDHGPFERFYLEAEARDQKMADNVIRVIRKNKADISVLVTGGFHAEGIQETLRKNNLTSITFVPKITSVDTSKESGYLSVFAQEKTSLDKIFDGEKLFLSQKPSVATSAYSKMFISVFHNLKGPLKSIHKFGNEVWTIVTRATTREIVSVTISVAASGISIAGYYLGWDRTLWSLPLMGVVLFYIGKKYGKQVIDFIMDFPDWYKSLTFEDRIAVSVLGVTLFNIPAAYFELDLYLRLTVSFVTLAASVSGYGESSDLWLVAQRPIKRVYIVEDSSGWIETYESIFDDQTFPEVEFVYFKDGESAIKSWQSGESPVDLFILDNHLNGQMTGKSVARILRQSEDNTPIMFIHGGDVKLKSNFLNEMGNIVELTKAKLHLQIKGIQQFIIDNQEIEAGQSPLGKVLRKFSAPVGQNEDMLDHIRNKATGIANSIAILQSLNVKHESVDRMAMQRDSYNQRLHVLTNRYRKEPQNKAPVALRVMTEWVEYIGKVKEFIGVAKSENYFRSTDSTIKDTIDFMADRITGYETDADIFINSARNILGADEFDQQLSIVENATDNLKVNDIIVGDRRIESINNQLIEALLSIEVDQLDLLLRHASLNTRDHLIFVTTLAYLIARERRDHGTNQFLSAFRMKIRIIAHMINTVETGPKKEKQIGYLDYIFNLFMQSEDVIAENSNFAHDGIYFHFDYNSLHEKLGAGIDPNSPMPNQWVGPRASEAVVRQVLFGRNLEDGVLLPSMRDITGDQKLSHISIFKPVMSVRFQEGTIQDVHLVLPRYKEEDTEYSVPFTLLTSRNPSYVNIITDEFNFLKSYRGDSKAAQVLRLGTWNTEDGNELNGYSSVFEGDFDEIVYVREEEYTVNNERNGNFTKNSSLPGAAGEISGDGLEKIIAGFVRLDTYFYDPIRKRRVSHFVSSGGDGFFHKSGFIEKGVRDYTVNPTYEKLPVKMIAYRGVVDNVDIPKFIDHLFKFEFFSSVRSEITDDPPYEEYLKKGVFEGLYYGLGEKYGDGKRSSLTISWLKEYLAAVEDPDNDLAEDPFITKDDVKEFINTLEKSSEANGALPIWFGMRNPVNIGLLEGGIMGTLNAALFAGFKYFSQAPPEILFTLSPFLLSLLVLNLSLIFAFYLGHKYLGIVQSDGSINSNPTNEQAILATLKASSSYISIPIISYAFNYSGLQLWTGIAIGIISGSIMHAIFNIHNFRIEWKPLVIPGLSLAGGLGDTLIDTGLFYPSLFLTEGAPKEKSPVDETGRLMVDPWIGLKAGFEGAMKLAHYIKESDTDYVLVSGPDGPLTAALIKASWIRLFGDLKLPAIRWINPELEGRLVELDRSGLLPQFKELIGGKLGDVLSSEMNQTNSLVVGPTSNKAEITEAIAHTFDALGAKRIKTGYILAEKDFEPEDPNNLVIGSYDTDSVQMLDLLAQMLIWVDWGDEEEIYEHFRLIDEIIRTRFSLGEIPPSLIPDSVAKYGQDVSSLETVSVVDPSEHFPNILSERGYTPLRIYGRGGSSSMTFLAENPEGDKVVVKYSDWDGISGNGTPWLVKQVEKLNHIQAEYPEEARPLYPKVLDFYQDGETAFYAMEYFEGATDITEYYFYDLFVSEESMAASVDSFVTLMADTHYRHDVEPYTDEYQKNVVDRLNYRLNLLTKHDGEVYENLIEGNEFQVGDISYSDSSYFFEDLMDAPYVAINGRVYPNLPKLVGIIENKREEIEERLGPTHFAKFSHGDLPMRNVLRLPNGDKKIIDVRGLNIHETSPSKTSVEYDLAKIAHGFYLEMVRNGLYQLNGTKEGESFSFNYDFHNYQGNTRYQAVRDRFYGILENNEALSGALSDSGTEWLTHVRLGEYVNYASDAIHRFSQDPTGEHPLMYYLEATKGLYEVLNELGFIDQDFVDEKLPGRGEPIEQGLTNVTKRLAKELSDHTGTVRVALTGGSTTGKTFITGKIVDEAEKLGRATPKVYVKHEDEADFTLSDQKHLSVDWFLRDRDTRQPIIKQVEEGKIALSHYQSFAWDMREYEKFLLVLDVHVKTRPNEIFMYTIPEAYNRQTGKKDLTIRIEIEPGSLVAIEGVGSVDDSNRNKFDISILTDKYDADSIIQASLNRQLTKKPEHQAPPEVVVYRLKATDIPRVPFIRLFTSYLSNFYLDNTDHDNPVLYSLSGPNSIQANGALPIWFGLRDPVAIGFLEGGMIGLLNAALFAGFKYFSHAPPEIHFPLSPFLLSLLVFNLFLIFAFYLSHKYLGIVQSDGSINSNPTNEQAILAILKASSSYISIPIISYAFSYSGLQLWAWVLFGILAGSVIHALLNNQNIQIGWKPLVIPGFSIAGIQNTDSIDTGIRLPNIVYMGRNKKKKNDPNRQTSRERKEARRARQQAEQLAREFAEKDYEPNWMKSPDLNGLSSELAQEYSGLVRSVLDEIDYDYQNRELRNPDIGGDYHVMPLSFADTFHGRQKVLEELHELRRAGDDEVEIRRIANAFRFFSFYETLSKREIAELFGNVIDENRTVQVLIDNLIKVGFIKKDGAAGYKLNGLALVSHRAGDNLVYAFIDAPPFLTVEDNRSEINYRAIAGQEEWYFHNMMQEIGKMKGKGIDYISQTGFLSIAALNQFDEVKHITLYDPDVRARNISLFNMGLNNISPDKYKVVGSEEELKSLSGIDFILSSPPFEFIPEKIEIPINNRFAFKGAVDSEGKFNLKKFHPSIDWADYDGLYHVRKILDLAEIIREEEPFLYLYTTSWANNKPGAGIPEFVFRLVDEKGWRMSFRSSKEEKMMFTSGQEATFDPSITIDVAMPAFVEVTAIANPGLVKTQAEFDELKQRFKDIYEEAGITHTLAGLVTVRVLKKKQKKHGALPIWFGLRNPIVIGFLEGLIVSTVNTLFYVGSSFRSQVPPEILYKSTSFVLTLLLINIVMVLIAFYGHKRFGIVLSDKSVRENPDWNEVIAATFAFGFGLVSSIFLYITFQFQELEFWILFPVAFLAGPVMHALDGISNFSGPSKTIDQKIPEITDEIDQSQSEDVLETTSEVEPEEEIDIDPHYTFFKRIRPNGDEVYFHFIEVVGEIDLTDEGDLILNDPQHMFEVGAFIKKSDQEYKEVPLEDDENILIEELYGHIMENYKDGDQIIIFYDGKVSFVELSEGTRIGYMVHKAGELKMEFPTDEFTLSDKKMANYPNEYDEEDSFVKIKQKKHIRRRSSGSSKTRGISLRHHKRQFTPRTIRYEIETREKKVIRESKDHNGALPIWFGLRNPVLIGFIEGGLYSIINTLVYAGFDFFSQAPPEVLYLSPVFVLSLIATNLVLLSIHYYSHLYFGIVQSNGSVVSNPSRKEALKSTLTASLSLLSILIIHQAYLRTEIVFVILLISGFITGAGMHGAANKLISIINKPRQHTNDINEMSNDQINTLHESIQSRTASHGMNVVLNHISNLMVQQELVENKTEGRRILLQYMVSNSTFDMGTGPRADVPRWLKNLGANKAYGMDIALKEEAEFLRRGRFENPWPFEENAFDLIFNFFSLDLNVPESYRALLGNWWDGNASYKYESMINEIERTLNEDGFMVITEGLRNPTFHDALEKAADQGRFHIRSEWVGEYKPSQVYVTILSGKSFTDSVLPGIVEQFAGSVKENKNTSNHSVFNNAVDALENILDNRHRYYELIRPREATQEALDALKGNFDDRHYLRKYGKAGKALREFESHIRKKGFNPDFDRLINMADNDRFVTPVEVNFRWNDLVNDPKNIHQVAQAMWELDLFQLMSMLPAVIDDGDANENWERLKGILGKFNHVNRTGQPYVKSVGTLFLFPESAYTPSLSHYFNQMKVVEEKLKPEYQVEVAIARVHNLFNHINNVKKEGKKRHPLRSIEIVNVLDFVEITFHMRNILIYLKNGHLSEKKKAQLVETIMVGAATHPRLLLNQKNLSDLVTMERTMFSIPREHVDDSIGYISDYYALLEEHSQGIHGIDLKNEFKKYKPTTYSYSPLGKTYSYAWYLLVGLVSYRLKNRIGGFWENFSGRPFESVFAYGLFSGRTWVTSIRKHFSWFKEGARKGLDYFESYRHKNAMARYRELMDAFDDYLVDNKIATTKKTSRPSFVSINGALPIWTGIKSPPIIGLIEGFLLSLVNLGFFEYFSAPLPMDLHMTGPFMILLLFINLGIFLTSILAHKYYGIVLSEDEIKGNVTWGEAFYASLKFSSALVSIIPIYYGYSYKGMDKLAFVVYGLVIGSLTHSLMNVNRKIFKKIMKYGGIVLGIVSIPIIGNFILDKYSNEIIRVILMLSNYAFGVIAIASYFSYLGLKPFQVRVNQQENKVESVNEKEDETADLLDPNQTIRGQALHLWFDEEAEPVIHAHPNVLIDQGFDSEDAWPLANQLKDSLLSALTNLDQAYSVDDLINEKQALFEIQKSNKIQRSSGEWIELPLPVRIDQNIDQEAMVTPYEIILHSRLLRAPPRVQSLVLSHALRRSIHRFEPEKQIHDVEIFQKTLQQYQSDNILQQEWNQWNSEHKPNSYYGRDWNQLFRRAAEILEVESEIENVFNNEQTVQWIYREISIDRPNGKVHPNQYAYLIQPLMEYSPEVYLEYYRNGKDQEYKPHVYFVFDIGDELKKVVRIVPENNIDAYSNSDASASQMRGGIRVDIIHDVQEVAQDIIEERQALSSDTQLLVLMDSVIHESGQEKQEAINSLKKKVLNATEDDTSSSLAADILFGLARTDPDRNVRIELNGFVFDQVTDRPIDFPPSDYNFSSFEGEKHRVTFRTPPGSRARVLWSQDGGEIQESDDAVKVHETESYWEYEWEVPVSQGWVHYSAQGRLLESSEWGFLNSRNDLPDVGDANGLVKFNTDVRGRRILGIRPEIFNMRMDEAHHPYVDSVGNINVGQLNDLEHQVDQLKNRFDELYVQVLNPGAPGEDGPDSSAFSPIDHMNVNPRIGGNDELLSLKEKLDEKKMSLTMDLIPHVSKSNRETSPKTFVWVQIGDQAYRRAATDGGLTNEWFDSALRNWSNRQNVLEFLNELAPHTAMGINRRVDVGHVFAKSFPPHHNTVGLARVRGEVVSLEREIIDFDGEKRDFFKSLDLWRTEEPEAVLASIIYPLGKLARQSGNPIYFQAENWHGHEARLIASGALPYDSLMANAWNTAKYFNSTDKYQEGMNWRNGILSRLGGGTGTLLNNHDEHVPVAHAFSWPVFAAVAPLIFSNGGYTSQFSHYSFRDQEGKISYEQLDAEYGRVIGHRFGPPRYVNGVYWPGHDWAQKFRDTNDVIAANPHIDGLGQYIKDIAKITEMASHPAKSLEVGHDRVIGLARKIENDDHLIMLAHQGPSEENGPAFAADINFHPNDESQNGNGLGVYQDEAVYSFTEIFNNEDTARSNENMAEPILLTGREITNLGIGPLHPLPIVGTQIYRLKKIYNNAHQVNGNYRTLLRSSIKRYWRYGPKDRFEHSFVSLEIINALEQGTVQFRDLFELLSDIVDKEDDLEIGRLSSIFNDIVTYRPDLRPKLHEALIDVAIMAEQSTVLVSRTAIKILRSSDIGQIVLVSEQSIWTSGTGGLGLYITDLADELTSLGIDVTVVLPLFQNEKSKFFEKYKPWDTGRTVTVKFKADGSDSSLAKLYEAKAGRVRIIGMENDDYFVQLKGKRDDGRSAYDGHPRFKTRFARMFSVASLKAIREMNIHPSVIQTAEWSTALMNEYLHGRDKIDPQLTNLDQDAHFAETKVFHIMHQLHHHYQGKIYFNSEEERDRIIRDDIGFDPQSDLGLFNYNADEGTINPTYTAVGGENPTKEGDSFGADRVGTVSQGYHDRSLDPNEANEFGHLHSRLQLREDRGEYFHSPNGFAQVRRQKDLFGASPLEMGHEQRRRSFAEYVFKEKTPVQKKILQQEFNLKEDDESFTGVILSFLHRISPEKGHQLLLDNVWSSERPYELKALSPGKYEKMKTEVHLLSNEEGSKLIEFAEKNKLKELRTIDAALLLMPELQVVVVGSVEPDSWFDLSFVEVAYRWQDSGRFAYHDRFIKMDDPKYEAIYSGSTIFGMPSYTEPGGLSNKEAAAAGVPRHTANRDGLVDSRLTVELPGEDIEERSVTEGFDTYNPVSWFSSLSKMYTVNKEDPELWDELRYQVFTQDNRWRRSAKHYIETYRELAGQPPVTELSAMEVGSAINRANMQNHADPADELLKTGFYSLESAEIAINAFNTTNNELLRRALRTVQIKSLAKIDNATRVALLAKAADLGIVDEIESIIDTVAQSWSAKKLSGFIFNNNTPLGETIVTIVFEWARIFGGWYLVSAFDLPIVFQLINIVVFVLEHKKIDQRNGLVLLGMISVYSLSYPYLTVAMLIIHFIFDYRIIKQRWVLSQIDMALPEPDVKSKSSIADLINGLISDRAVLVGLHGKFTVKLSKRTNRAFKTLRLLYRQS